VSGRALLFVVAEDETMNGSYPHNVSRRCLPFGFCPRQVVVLPPHAFLPATT
jgi:hypothetical protein